MAFTPESYLDAKEALDQISHDAHSHYRNIERALEQIVLETAKLEAMRDQWVSTITFITAQRDGDPDKEIYQIQKAEADEIVTDFLGKRDSARAIRDAAQAAKNG